MTGQNDVVFVEQEVLRQRKRSRLAKSTLRRVRWSKLIDHSVLYVTVSLAAVSSQPKCTKGEEDSSEAQAPCDVAGTSEVVAGH